MLSINYRKLNHIMGELGWSYSRLSEVARIGHGTAMGLKNGTYQPKKSNAIRKVVTVLKYAGYDDAVEILANCPPLTANYDPKITLIKQKMKASKVLNDNEITAAIKAKKTKGVTMISKNVLDYFSLKSDPFESKIPLVNEMYSNSKIDKVEDAIIQAATENKFLLVQGECGAGKTTLMKRVLRKLNRLSRLKVSVPDCFFVESIRERHIGEAIINDFGDQEPPQSLLARGKMIRQIATQNYKNKVKMVLVIDEAHRMTRDTLRSLKRFWEGFSPDGGISSVMGIIMFGQPYIQELLSAPNMAEVNQRLSVIELSTLDDALGVDNVRGYIEHKIKIAGGDISIFDPEAADEVMKYAETPLQVNNLMRKALQAAFEMKEKKISREVIEYV